MKHHKITDGSTEENVVQDLATDGMTVFMCEECNSVFLSQDSLAVHILAAHMKQGWTTAEEGQGDAEGEGGHGEVTSESEVHDGIYGDNQMVVELPLQQEVPLASATATTASSSFASDQHIKSEMQEAVETLVTISDPNCQQRTITLIHPSPSKNGNFTTTQQSMEVEGEEIVEEEVPYVPASASYEPGTNLNTSNPNVEVQNIIDIPPTSQGEQLVMSGDGQDQETFVTFTDPNTNQEYMLAVESDAIANLLSTTVAIETDSGDQEEQQYVEVAETVEIAEAGETQTQQENKGSVADGDKSQSKVTVSEIMEGELVNDDRQEKDGDQGQASQRNTGLLSGESGMSQSETVNDNEVVESEMSQTQAKEVVESQMSQTQAKDIVEHVESETSHVEGGESSKLQMSQSDSVPESNEPQLTPTNTEADDS